MCGLINRALSGLMGLAVWAWLLVAAYAVALAIAETLLRLFSPR